MGNDVQYCLNENVKGFDLECLKKKEKKHEHFQTKVVSFRMICYVYPELCFPPVLFILSHIDVILSLKY